LGVGCYGSSQEGREGKEEAKKLYLVCQYCADNSDIKKDPKVETIGDILSKYSLLKEDKP